MESSSSSRSNKKYCIAVDGSQYSEWAFDLVLNELYEKGDKIVIVHISNPDKSANIPFAYQSETIFSKFDAKLTGKLLRGDYQLVKQDRNKSTTHALTQVNQIAVANGCTVLVMGFHGHKENKQKNEMSKGTNYIMTNIKIPTIVVKENITRKDRESGAFTWMASIEQANSRSFKAFEFATNYVNLSKDKVIATHVQTYNENLSQEIEEYFGEFCKKIGINNNSYKLVQKEGSDIGIQISNFVNYNDTEVIDFVILGHNPNKYKSGDTSASPVEIVIKSAKANILFYS